MGNLLGWVGFVVSVQSVGLHFNSLGLNIGHSDKKYQIGNSDFFEFFLYYLWVRLLLLWTF